LNSARRTKKFSRTSKTNKNYWAKKRFLVEILSLSSAKKITKKAKENRSVSSKYEFFMLT